MSSNFKATEYRKSVVLDPELTKDTLLDGPQEVASIISATELDAPDRKSVV